MQLASHCRITLGAISRSFRDGRSRCLLNTSIDETPDQSWFAEFTLPQGALIRAVPERCDNESADIFHICRGCGCHSRIFSRILRRGPCALASYSSRLSAAIDRSSGIDIAAWATEWANRGLLAQRDGVRDPRAWLVF